MNRLAPLARRLRRAVLARRRLLAAVSAAGAVAAGLQAASAPPPPRTLVLTASHDIAGGTVVRAADLALVPFAPDSVPSGVLSSAADATGRTTVGPIRSGEPISDVRLLGASLLRGYSDAVAAPVRIGDPGAVDLLRVGDRVDVIAADPRGGGADVVAADAPVVAIPRHADSAPNGVSGGLIVVAASDQTARALAAAGVSSYLSIVINR